MCVPQLTAGESARLLERRVIGLPVVFAMLCHCLSGGLPRDLIRQAIGVHLAVAWDAVSRFRLGHGLRPLTAPRFSPDSPPRSAR